MDDRTDAGSWPAAPSYAVDLYAGTAEMYAAHRIPYPTALLDSLLGQIYVPAARLLDIACGTGELAIPLSRHFADTIAIDQEPSMIEVGRRNAATAGATNITWIAGAAEALTLPDDSIALITIGNAFHRLDRLTIAHKAIGWLEPDGLLAIVNTDSVWRGTEPWQRAAVDVIAKWTAAPATPSAQTPRLTHSEVLSQAGYQQISEETYTAEHNWSIDGFIGYLHSTSLASKAALGPHVSTFEAEMRQTMLGFQRSGQLRETARFSCLTARRPRT